MMKSGMKIGTAPLFSFSGLEQRLPAMNELFEPQEVLLSHEPRKTFLNQEINSSSFFNGGL